jgi:hypothetical protein
VTLWRRIAINAALISVTLEAALCAALWTPLHLRFNFLVTATITEGLLLIVGLPCAFAWRGKARWWLRVRALALPLISIVFIIALTAE